MLRKLVRPAPALLVGPRQASTQMVEHLVGDRFVSVTAQRFGKLFAIDSTVSDYNRILCTALK